MSSNSFTWVTEGGDLGTADWGCLAGRCASLCLQATLVSDEKHIRGVVCEMHYTNSHLYLFYLVPTYWHDAASDAVLQNQWFRQCRNHSYESHKPFQQQNVMRMRHREKFNTGKFTMLQ